jgi:hypothetical protein
VEAAVRETRAGFQATVYELGVKAYLAILFNSISLDEMLKRVDNKVALTILATMFCALEPNSALP